jgi:chromate transporter
MKRGSPLEVLLAFFLLGVSSFGGPVAHFGYFRRTFVERRKWLSDTDFAGLLSLCQFLPGPSSSQLGFCIGLHRAGWLGGLAAWLGFTLPSAFLMYELASHITAFQDSALAHAALHGLQLAAVAIVAQAVYVMGVALCPDLPRRLLAILAMAMVFLIPGIGGQIMVLLIGALVGAAALTAAPPPERPDSGITHFGAILCLSVFGVLLVLSLLPTSSPGDALGALFYHTGALVFGGGHVVLPLLRTAILVPGIVSRPDFLDGYGAAQAMPGPLFSVATFYGAVAFNGAGAGWGAAIATIAIFLPGMLLAAGALPFWHSMQVQGGWGTAVLGVNAAVVGLLGYALCSLVFRGAINGVWDSFIVLAAMLALIRYRAAPILVVASCVLAAIFI